VPTRPVQPLRPGAAFAAIRGTGAEQHLAMTVTVWLMPELLRPPGARGWDAAGTLVFVAQTHSHADDWAFAFFRIM